MEALSQKAFEAATAAQHHLLVAEAPLQFLAAVDWPKDVRGKFLGSWTLPEISYKRIDVAGSLQAIDEARKSIDGDHPVLAWLRRLADSLETTAHLIAARGTPQFFEQSKLLFGEPTRFLLDKKTRVIDLAHHLDAALDGLDRAKLALADEESPLSASDFAERLRPLLAKYLGAAAPQVELVRGLSAKASAGPKRIHVRADATFSARDIDQLLQHEALVHTATALNGNRQDSFPILGRAHAESTEIQEGLAVFAEMISGSMDPARFRRLSDRVIAIQKAIDGADFNDIFDYYLDRTDDPDESFENAKRVFRGGVVTGCAPFTKDIVYLNGLLRVHNYMRTVVELRRADLIRLLFAGKLDLEDIPAIAQLANDGKLSRPVVMPPWVRDMRFLVSSLAYSSFLNQVSLPGFQSYYLDELSGVPDTWDFAG